MRWTVVALVVGVLALGAVARYLPIQQSLSRADEYVFIDALDKASRGDVVEQGEHLDPYTLTLLQCRGISDFGPVGPPCGQPFPLSKAPFGGVTSADAYTPTYFFLTAWLAKGLLLTPFVQDLLVAGRLVDGLWLWAGLMATIALARSLGASGAASVAVALLMLTAPATRWTNTYLTPDSMSILLGAVAALAAVKVSRRQWPVWAMVPVAALATAVKVTNIVVLGAVVAFLVLKALPRPTAQVAGEPRTRELARSLVAAGVVMGTTLATELAWLWVRSRLAVGPPPEQNLQPFPLTPHNAGSTMVRFMRGIVVGPDSVNHLGDIASFRGEVISWLLVSGVVAAALFGYRRREDVVHLGRATMLTLVTAGPGLLVLLLAAQVPVFDLPERYASSALPLMGAVTAALVKDRWVALAVLAFAVVVYVHLVVFAGTW